MHVGSVKFLGRRLASTCCSRLVQGGCATAVDLAHSHQLCRRNAVSCKAGLVDSCRDVVGVVICRVIEACDEDVAETKRKCGIFEDEIGCAAHRTVVSVVL